MGLGGRIYADLGFVAVFSTGLGAFTAGAFYATFVVKECRRVDKDDASKITKRDAHFEHSRVQICQFLSIC